MGLCIDCSLDISSIKSLSTTRCDPCYKKYRNEVYFPAYRKTEKRKETVKRDNDSEKARARKRKYNNSTLGKKTHKKYELSSKGRTSSKAQVLKRRARIAGLPKEYNNFTTKDLRALEKEYKSCAYCGKQETKTNKLEIEHVYSINQGGENIPENMVRACRKCNMSKFDKIIEVWFDENPDKKQYFYSLEKNRKRIEYLQKDFYLRKVFI